MDWLPFQHCPWTHRFDHPYPHPPSLPIYRTLYCAEQRKTCFREILDRFVSSVQTAERLSTSQGLSLEDALQLGGQVPMDLLLDKAIAPARIRILSGELVDLDEPGVRRKLEIQHRDLLKEHGLDSLDISAARSRRRIVTRTIGHSLFHEGAAGVVYGSNVDNLRCFALFESRAELEPVGEPEHLADLLAEIEPILRERHLTLRPASAQP